MVKSKADAEVALLEVKSLVEYHGRLQPESQMVLKLISVVEWLVDLMPAPVKTQSQVMAAKQAEIAAALADAITGKPDEQESQ